MVACLRRNPNLVFRINLGCSNNGTSRRDIRDSYNFAGMGNKLIGLYDFGSSGGLFGFNNKIICAAFHCGGITLSLVMALKIAVRSVMLESGSSCKTLLVVSRSFLGVGYFNNCFYFTFSKVVRFDIILVGGIKKLDNFYYMFGWTLIMGGVEKLFQMLRKCSSFFLVATCPAEMWLSKESNL